MIRNRAVILLLIVSLVLAIPATLFGRAPKLDDVLPSLTEGDYGTLLNEGELLRFHGDGVSPTLIPNAGPTGTVVRQIVQGDLNMGIEGLFFTPLDKLPAGYSTADESSRDLVLYNIMRSVSTLQGLQYYSASRGEMRLLFEESWRVADESSRDPLPDDFVTAIPSEDTIMIFQKDKSFGRNFQEMTFREESGSFAVTIINKTPMRYSGIIRVVDPENMQIHLIITPVEEGLLIYGTMSAHTLEAKAFQERAQNSFTNRVIALAGWYRERLIEEF